MDEKKANESHIDEKLIRFICSDGEECFIPSDVLNSIPFLSTLTTTPLRVKRIDEDDKALILPAEAKSSYLQTIVRFLKSGKTSDLVRKLPRSENICEFLESFQFLCIEFPSGYEDINVVFEGMRHARFSYRERYHWLSTSNARHIGRNAAVLFIFGLASDAYQLRDHKIRNQVFNCVEILVSHPGRFFGKRTRYHFIVIYKHKAHNFFTPKQQNRIHKWIEKFAGNESDSDTCSDYSSADDSIDYDWNESDSGTCSDYSSPDDAINYDSDTCSESDSDTCSDY